MRLIDADATIKEIKARNPDDVSYEDAWAITCIEHAPTIEPERTWKMVEGRKIMNDLISRQAAIDFIDAGHLCNPNEPRWSDNEVVNFLKSRPSAQPERLADDDFETIRIHLNAYKEKLGNQHRWKEAEEYQRIIDRFMSFASAQPEWNNHTVACLLAELFDDPCACNYNGIDEWLPEKCEVIDSCPHPVGVACWEQYLKHRAERRTDEQT